MNLEQKLTPKTFNFLKTFLIGKFNIDLRNITEEDFYKITDFLINEYEIPLSNADNDNALSKTQTELLENVANAVTELTGLPEY